MALDFNSHPYINGENYRAEREEWENNPRGVDRTGRHHTTFGCMFDWWDRKVAEWRNNPQAALDDARTYAEQHGERDVWMEDELKELIAEKSQVSVDA